MKYIIPILIALSAISCSTPTTMLKNPETGQIVHCGGNATGSMLGGVVGYHIQKGNDSKCVANYAEQGFKRIQIDKAIEDKQ